MRKGLPVLLVLLGIVLIGGCYSCNIQKSLVALDEDVKGRWADVQNQYQRRADLIPNLVATVKGAANFEQQTQVGVAAERAGRASGALKSAATTGTEPTDENVQRLQQAAAEAQTAARNFINISVEAYPQLRATEAFLGLQTQLEGTENRVTTSRNAYNRTVQDYNVKVRTFPNNIFAGMLGFQQRATFQAAPGSEAAPKVDFGG